ASSAANPWSTRAARANGSRRMPSSASQARWAGLRNQLSWGIAGVFIVLVPCGNAVAMRLDDRTCYQSLVAAQRPPGNERAHLCHHVVTFIPACAADARSRATRLRAGCAG